MSNRKAFRGKYYLHPSEKCDGVCIPLTKDRHAIIDADDFDKISGYLWHAHVHLPHLIYAVTNDKYSKKRPHLHRKIMSAQENQIIDHINHNALDNRKCNLRLCSQSENIHHTRISKRNTSGYKGVDFVKRCKLWRAKICINYKVIQLGHYKNPEDAATAYNFAAFQYHGEFAVFNKPKKMEHKP